MCTWKPKVLADPRDYQTLYAPKKVVSDEKEKDNSIAMT